MMLVILFFTLLAVFLSLVFIPYWTRKTESFGVSIPERLYKRADFEAMRKRYVLFMSILSLVLLAIFWVSSYFLKDDDTLLGIVFSAIILIFIVASFLIYLKFHFSMKKIKEKENWAEDKVEKTFVHTKFREQSLTISNWWYLLPFLLTIGLGVFTLMNYDHLPNQIPMNYNLSGDVTNWKEKSYGTVLILPAIQLFLVLMFLFINIIIAKSKQQVSVENPERSLQQNIIFRRRWSIFLYSSLLAMVLMFSFMHLGDYFWQIEPVFLIALPMIVSFGTVIGAVILSVTTGQGGSRVKLSDELDDRVINRDDDRYWKLGQFYFNKEDPAIFIEKRFGVGWTMNFARPLGWFFLIAVIALPFLIVFVLTNF